MVKQLPYHPTHQPTNQPNTKPNPKPKTHQRAKKQTVSEKFEQQVYALVHSHFPNALKEVYVYLNEYKIVEIDIVLVHNSGIYIFEAKVKRGKIFGVPTQPYWTAQHTERKATRFYNPLRQTEAHVKHLVKRYRISPMSCHSVIVFNDGADISEIRYSTNQTTTCTYKDLPNILQHIKRNMNTPISPFILEDIYHDLSAKSGVQKYRDLHKEVLLRNNPSKRRSIQKHR